MRTVYAFLISIIPYLASITGYIWIGRHVLKLDRKVYRTMALILLGLGLSYTVYELVREWSVRGAGSTFNFMLIFVTILVLLIVSIIMAAAEPDEKEQQEEKPETPA
jgi:hypothetical protein